MLGSVATCNLVQPHNYSTNFEGGYIVCKITITPTEMTFRRFAGFMGAKFRWPALKAPVDGGNEITFSTRKKGAGGVLLAYSLPGLFLIFARRRFWFAPGRTCQESKVLWSFCICIGRQRCHALVYQPFPSLFRF